MAAPTILLTPALVFSCLYGITLIIYIYEIWYRKRHLRGFIHIATLIYFILKTVGYCIRSAEAALFPTPQLYSNVAILVPAQLFLFIGSVVIVKGLQIHIALPVAMLKCLGHTQHERRRKFFDKFVNLCIPVWMVLGISAIAFQASKTPGITQSDLDIVNALRRTSSWVGFAAVFVLTEAFMFLSWKLRRLARNNIYWNEEDCFQLFITGRLRVFSCIMLLIGTVYTAVSSLLNAQTDDVFLRDYVFYCLKGTTEWLAAVSLIRAQPDFHQAIKTQVYDRLKHRLTYWPRNIQTRMIEDGKLKQYTPTCNLAQITGHGRLIRGESWMLGSVSEEELQRSDVTFTDTSNGDVDSSNHHHENGNGNKKDDTTVELHGIVVDDKSHDALQVKYDGTNSNDKVPLAADTAAANNVSDGELRG